VKKRPWLCVLLTALGGLLGPWPARAQQKSADPPPRQYVAVPFVPDLDGALDDQLRNASGEAALKLLLDIIKKDPGIFRLNGQNLADADFNDPRLRKTLEKLFNEPERMGIDPEQKKVLQQNQPFIQQKLGLPKPAAESKTPTKIPPPPQQREAASPLPTHREGPVGPDLERILGDDLLARWTKDFMREADRWEWDDLVKESPAIQSGLRDLNQLFTEKAGTPRFTGDTLRRWAEALRPKGGWNSSLPDLGWARPDSLSLPALPRPGFRLPGSRSLGGVRPPRIGFPRMGAPALGRGFGQGALWMAVLALAGLTVWLVVRHWTAAARGRPSSSWQLGPWPVDPAQVATPAELIQAFEYLSLLKLGPDARSRNHRALAAGLADQEGADAGRRLAADELAGLYERARYAPALDSLPPATIASARRALCLLAGVGCA
jgi:hypothetical protein